MTTACRPRRQLFLLTLALCMAVLGTGAAAPQAPDFSRSPSPEHLSDTAQQRPTWAIAHRVLTRGGVTKALEHGANAIEIDATAWRDGWWADHDGTLTSYGDRMTDMFGQLVEEKRAGRHIAFVWLDIKNPDWCSSSDPKWRHCSVAALRDLARARLQSEGIRVLYGFYL